MIPLPPAESFRRLHPEEAVDLARAVDAKWLRVGLNYALAQVAHEGATADELKGIERFVATFLTFHTAPKEPAKLPDKSRLETFEPDGLNPKKDESK